jgi:hypothetical protein
VPKAVPGPAVAQAAGPGSLSERLGGPSFAAQDLASSVRCAIASAALAGAAPYSRSERSRRREVGGARRVRGRDDQRGEPRFAHAVPAASAHRASDAASDAARQASRSGATGGNPHWRE